MLLGARLLAAADDSVAVWVARVGLAEGSQVSADDVDSRQVRFLDAEQAAVYVSADEPPPAGATLSRPVGAGELLPRAALSDTGTGPAVEIPVAVPAEAVASSLRVGETVDVWVTLPAGQGGEASAEPVFEGVRVVALPDVGGALGPATTRQVVVGLPARDDERLGPALARLASGSAVVVRRPG
jgi:hypothetical protein